LQQTRVLTWPVLTVVPFVAQPSVYMSMAHTSTHLAPNISKPAV